MMFLHCLHRRRFSEPGTRCSDFGDSTNFSIETGQRDDFYFESGLFGVTSGDAHLFLVFVESANFNFMLLFVVDRTSSLQHHRNNLSVALACRKGQRRVFRGGSEKFIDSQIFADHLHCENAVSSVHPQHWVGCARCSNSPLAVLRGRGAAGRSSDVRSTPQGEAH